MRTSAPPEPASMASTSVGGPDVPQGSLIVSRCSALTPMSVVHPPPSGHRTATSRVPK